MKSCVPMFLVDTVFDNKKSLSLEALDEKENSHD